MNADALRLLFPKASQSFIRANSPGSVATNPQPERAPQHEPLAAGKGKARDARSRVVSVTSFRCKLLDPGANLWGGTKYLEDSLRYCGLLHDDSEAFIQITVSQQKVKTRKEERTELTISI